jgi:branched-chain amino acid transport system permease protein
VSDTAVGGAAVSRATPSRRGPWRATFTRQKVVISSAFVLLAALLPLIDTSQYGMDVFITALIIMLLNTSWNFILGIAGVWNFGQLAMYAGGGYGAGLLILHASVPPWLAIVGGGIAGALLATVVAFPTLRLYGIYTSLLTFAAAEVMQLVIQNDDTGTTGGAFGLPSVRNLYPSLSPLWSARAWYWTCLAILVVAVAGTAVLVRTPFGLSLRTLRDSLPYGSARGIAPRSSRVMAFAVSGFMAGIAGALYTIYNGSISPTVMGLTPLSIYVTMIVVGGLGTITGPLIGTLLLTLVQQLLIDDPGTELTVLGIVLLVIVVFFPRGLVDEVEKVRRRVVEWMDATEPAEVEPAAEEAISSGAAGS